MEDCLSKYLSSLAILRMSDRFFLFTGEVRQTAVSVFNPIEFAIAVFQLADLMLCTIRRGFEERENV